MEVLKLENLSKYYTSQTSVVMGLSNINLSFSVGEFVAVTGESGSGKSTLAHVLGGILPYESGELYINGHRTSHYDSADWERYRRDLVGFISQNYGILAGNTVLENVESALRLSGIAKSEAKERAEDILAKVELSEYKSRRASKLSSGQKQRLSIARALAKPSKILIADEPTGNLDRENSEKIIALLKKASEDRLVILITHDFDEAKDAATRRIILSDGIVVTDSELRVNEYKCKKDITPKQIKKKRTLLVPYVASLTLRSRPMFSAVMCLLLAFTMFITFVFLGTFTLALDDTSTRIYDTTAFRNGDPSRIVVMRADGQPLNEEDHARILSVKYTESLERAGYINDVNYYYRPEVDYHLYYVTENGPNYHPLLNPDDYQVTENVEFWETGLFLRTVPKTNDVVDISGKLPEGVYEVLSADPDHKIGDEVKVYIRNQNDWSVSAYICLTFTVVGETDSGEGLYFSDKLAAMISGAVKNSPYTSNGAFGMIFAPYAPEQFELLSYLSESGKVVVVEDEDDAVVTDFVLNDNEFIYPGSDDTEIDLKWKYPFSDANGEMVYLSCAAMYKATYPALMIVTESTFERLTSFAPSNQASLYIKDYAYATRVISDLEGMGYLAISPFRLGATEIDKTLANERSITIWVCLAALALTVILQIILLRAMFSSLYEHFKLLANIGLVAKTALGSVALLMLFFTIVGELIGGAVIISLNALGVARITELFAHLEFKNVIVLIGAHLASVALALATTLTAINKAVFSKKKHREDIDISQMEEA